MDIKESTKVQLSQKIIYLLLGITLVIMTGWHIKAIQLNDTMSKIGICLRFCITVGIFGVAVFFLWKFRDKYRANNLFMYMSWILLPLFTFVSVELIAGDIRKLTWISIVKNLLMYYLLYFILSAFVRQLGILAMVYVGMFDFLALVQHFVTLFRARPMMLQDFLSFGTAARVVGNYTFYLTYHKYVVVLGMILLIFAFTLSGKKIFMNRRYFTGIGILGVSFGLVAMLLMPNKFLNEIYMWDLISNYEEDGLLLTFLEEIPYLMPEKPEDYSVSSVKKIADKVEKIEVNEVAPQNLIVIMNESFADLDYIGKVESDTELLSFYKGLQENTIRGYLSVPSFGGGTANTEYEVLTGNTLEFLTAGTTAYQMNVKKQESGITSTLREQGFQTLALHPYYGGGWNRNEVYPCMSFDNFVSMENWGDLETIRWCASDASAYQRVIDTCESTDEKLFMFLVTMQNHGGYDYEDYQSTVSLNYADEYPMAEQYLSLLQESDRAFQSLIEHFQNVEEPTMIVMFGDHQASIEDAFYEQLFGKSLSELSCEEYQERFITPFVIWANYDIEEQSDILMSSNYFGSFILKNAGMKMTKYNEFLLNLYEEIPVIGIGAICDKEGNWYQWGELPDYEKQLIQEYKILQYNNVSDRKKRVETVFFK